MGDSLSIYQLIYPITYWILLGISVTGYGAFLSAKFKIEMFGSRFSYRITIGLAFLLLLIAVNVFIIHIETKIFYPVLLIGGLYLFKKNCNLPSLKLLLDNRFSKIEKITFFIVAGSWALKFFYSFYYPSANAYDDLLSYFVHIKMILERTDLIDPFSLRRLASYGGQPILQSLFVFNLPIQFVGTFEIGLINLVCCFLIYDYGRLKNAPPFLSFLCILFFLWSDQYRINTASQSTGFLFCFFGIVLLEKINKKVEENGYYLLSVILAALSYLRANYLSFVCLFYFLFFLAQLWNSNRANSRMLLTSFLLFLCLLAPGAFGLYISSNTVLFPLFKGNYIDNGTFHFFKFLYEKIVFSGKVFFNSDARIVFVVLLVSVFQGKITKVWNLLFLSCLLIFVTVIFSISGTHDIASAERYMFGISFPLFIQFLLNEKFYTKFTKLGLKEVINKVLPGAVFLVLLGGTLFQVYDFASTLEGMPVSILEIYKENSIYSSQLRKLQTLVPKGEKIIATVEKPYLFDFSRNPIFSLDIIANASPKSMFNPNLPDRNIKEQFNEMGYQWLLSEDFKQCQFQYSYQYWYRSVTAGRIVSKNGIFIPSEATFGRNHSGPLNWAYTTLNFHSFIENEIKSKDLVAQDERFRLINLNSGSSQVRR